MKPIALLFILALAGPVAAQTNAPIDPAMAADMAYREFNFKLIPSQRNMAPTNFAAWLGREATRIFRAHPNQVGSRGVVLTAAIHLAPAAAGQMAAASNALADIKALLAGAGPSADDLRAEVRSIEIESTLPRTSQGAWMAAYIEGQFQLLREFPAQTNIAMRLVNALMQAPDDVQNNQAFRLLESPALPRDLVSRVEKIAAGRIRAPRHRVGFPVDLGVTAADGRRVDAKDLHGRVVLVYFWSASHPPSLAPMPMIKDTYAALHERGFEVVGVSFDTDRALFDAAVREQAMSWPNACEGKAGFDNSLGEQFALASTPCLFLLDREGVLRFPDASADLRAKVESLLTEPRR